MRECAIVKVTPEQRGVRVRERPDWWPFWVGFDWKPVAVGDYAGWDLVEAYRLQACAVLYGTTPCNKNYGHVTVIEDVEK